MTEEQLRIILEMPGWCNEMKAKKLYSLVSEFSPLIIVELGTYAGRSLIPMALACKKNGHGICFGVDAWRKDASLEGTNDPANAEWWSNLDYNDIYAHALHVVNHFGLNDIVCLTRAKSLTVSVMFGYETIDMLHQDSNHSEEVTCQEVEIYAQLIKPGGIWISDDSNWPTVQKSLELLKTKGFRHVNDYTNSEGTQQFTVFIKEI